MEKRNYKLYIHTVPKSISKYKYDKYYIGITNREKMIWRWGENGEGYERQIFYNAILKYGWDNINHEVLYDNLTKTEAIELEQKMILKYDSLCGHYGYNVTNGGDGLKGVRCNKSVVVYGIEYGVAFWNSKIASQYTGENQYTISNRSKFDLNKTYTIGTHWCRENFIYKYLDKSSPQSKPVVHLKTKIIYENSTKAKEHTGINFNRKSVLDINTYSKKKRNNTLNLKDRIMFLKDYLYFYDYAFNQNSDYEISNGILIKKV